MADPLDQLQNPQPASAPSNVALINAFNNADASQRARANAFGAGMSPEMDDKIMRLYSIDGRLLKGESRPELWNPNIAQQAKLLNAMGRQDDAYNLASEENHRALALDSTGGPMSEEQWQTLRDYAGRKSAAQANRAQSSDTGPVSFPGGEMRQQTMTAAYASPTAKQDLYDIGVKSFDTAFGKHKKYLVPKPQLPLKAVAQASHVAPDPRMMTVQKSIEDLLRSTSNIQRGNQ